MSSHAKISREIDFNQLTESLITSYVKGCVAQAQKHQASKLKLTDAKDASFINSIRSNLAGLEKLSIPGNIEKALESIDLGKIYEESDKLEAAEKEKAAGAEILGYEDCIVKATLKYFKDDFFKWVNQPSCPVCNTDVEVRPIGSKAPPSVNPDEISMIEVHQCGKCKSQVEFPRINNPAKLLETREGRCGEWVNCFMLILKSLSSCQVRYVWNAEDHVWCEYYSKNLKRWVHLDPCENVFDEPSLYCENWRKKMSWVIGIGENYICDLSSKYVTTDTERLPKSAVASETAVKKYIDLLNASLLLASWRNFDSLGKDETEKCQLLYNEVLLIKEQEHKRTAGRSGGTKTSLPLGRQTGSASWTASRGEDGKT